MKDMHKVGAGALAGGGTVLGLILAFHTQFVRPEIDAAEQRVERSMLRMEHHLEQIDDRLNAMAADLASWRR